MKNFLSQINFKSNIKFCTPSEFQQNKPSNFTKEHPVDYSDFFRTQEKYHKEHPDEASWPWNIQSIRNEADIATGDIFTCSAGSITGVDNHSISVRYHFVPEKPNIDALLSNISPINQKLDEGIRNIGDKNLSTLIIGGNITVPNLKENSKRLFIILVDFFRQRGIDPSYFWGQNSSNNKRGTDAYYTAKDDYWHILKYKANSNQVVSSIEDLKEAFEYSHLGKNDKLYFKDLKTPITPLEFMSRFRFFARTI